MWKRRQSRAKMEIQEFQDGRTSTLDPEASNLVKFIMFARLSCAISTHIVCLDVDHRLLLVIGVIKSVHLSQWKNSYVVRCKWMEQTTARVDWPVISIDTSSRSVTLRVYSSSWAARARDVITRLMNEFLRSLFYIYTYIREYLLNY